jgi:hypothetical protein
VRKPEKRAKSHGTKPPKSATKSRPKSATKEEFKWTTLEHGGVLFPPEYTPHGVKLKYDGVPVDLTPEQEEVATMYATMLETDYITQKKRTFLDNFWAAFKPLLGKDHVVKCLEKCDFRDIYNHLMAEREAKKNLSKEVRPVPLLPAVTFPVKPTLDNPRASSPRPGFPIYFVPFNSMPPSILSPGPAERLPAAQQLLCNAQHRSRHCNATPTCSKAQLHLAHCRRSST